jgi:hypothetical protein
MHLSPLDEALWAAGILGHAALLLILLVRRRARNFPTFTAYISLQILSTAVLYADYRFFNWAKYTNIYWLVAGLDFFLLLGVLVEVSFAVLRPNRQWIGDSRRSILALSLLGLLIAFGLTFWVHPSRPASLSVWEDRANLFTSILTCELFTAILLTSQRTAAHWRSHIMGLGIGLTVWAIMCFIVEGMHAYWGDATHFQALENARKMAYLGTLVFWIISFWRDEPEREQLPPEMRDAILHLTDKVSYDLAKALGTRGKELH